jgi:hypothetical protein
MRLSSFEHENMLTTTDFIFSYLRLQAMGEYYTLVEGHIFERMTQVASTGYRDAAVGGGFRFPDLDNRLLLLLK